MADLTPIRTRSINRSKLTKLAGGDGETMRYLESLGLDVTESIPDNTGAALAAAAAAQLSANEAQATADDAQSRADALSEGVFGRRPALVLNLRQGPLIAVSRDGAGYVIAVDEGQLSAAIRTMAPRPPTPTPPDDVQLQIASQTFSRR